MHSPEQSVSGVPGMLLSCILFGENNFPVVLASPSEDEEGWQHRRSDHHGVLSLGVRSISTGLIAQQCSPFLSALRTRGEKQLLPLVEEIPRMMNKARLGP
eukprot:scaffold1813_cov185-Alexandrium_tamarense.AAC.18